MRRIVLFALLLSFAAPVAAQANSQTAISIMMDDDQLLYRGDKAREFAMGRMKALGVDYVRATVLWKVVAHRMKKKNRRKGEKPSAYQPASWDRYDRLVQSGRRNGIGVYFNVTGPGPRWAHGKPPKSERKYRDTWEPDARKFGDFVQAVGRRYNGTYSDENAGHEKLPKVSFWAIYNEPNQPGWLTPQYKNGVPWSPVMYRDLWDQGRRALDATGHKNDVVLIGETAPLGNTNTNSGSPLYPKKFVREFFCRDSRGNAYSGSSAAKRRCSRLPRLEPFNYTAWAHHPYTKTAAPTARDSNRDAITMANVGELSALLKSIPVKRAPTAALGLAAMTEFGYETNPPDPFSGVSLAKQAEYINVGDYLAYKETSVIANTQFQLIDVAGVKKYPKSDKRHWFTYQSGLLTAAGKPKPAAFAYQFPLVLTASGGGTASFWGHTRFLPPGVTPTVQMQFKAAGTGDFVDAGEPVEVKNPNGFFETTIQTTGPGTWRASFTNPYNGITTVSREVTTS